MSPLQTHCGGGELQLGLAGPPRLHKLLCEWLKRLRNPLDAQSTSHSPRQSRHGPVVLFSKASVQHRAEVSSQLSRRFDSQPSTCECGLVAVGATKVGAHPVLGKMLCVHVVSLRTAGGGSWDFFHVSSKTTAPQPSACPCSLVDKPTRLSHQQSPIEHSAEPSVYCVHEGLSLIHI